MEAAAPSNGVTTPAPPKPASTVLALRAPGGVIPQTLDDVWHLASKFAKSSLVRSALRDRPEDVMLILMQGLELNLKPVQALTGIYVVDGQPSLSAKLKVSLVLASGECEKFDLLHSDARKATFEVKRRGRAAVKLSWTIEEAAAAGLANNPKKDNWVKYPTAMLRWRCASALCDLIFPDVVGGMPTREELEDMREVRGSHTVMQSVAPPRGEPEVVEPVDDGTEMFGRPVSKGDDAAVDPNEAPAPEPQQAEPAKRMTVVEELHILIDESVSRAQLNTLTDRINAVRDVEANTALQQHWTRRFTDLKKAGK